MAAGNMSSDGGATGLAARDLLRALGRIEYPQAREGGEVMIHGRRPEFGKELIRTLSIHSSKADRLRGAIVNEGRGFHRKAGTLTPKVEAALERLEHGCPLLRVSHQPNTLAGLNTLEPLLSLTELGHSAASAAGSTSPAILFLIVDYDSASDQRFRQALLPSQGGHRVSILADAVPRALRRQIAASVPPVDTATLTEWRDLFMKTVKAWAERASVINLVTVDPGEAVELAAMLMDLARDAMSSAPTLTEANATLISKLCNGVWGLDAIFVRERALWPHIADDLNRFLALATADNQAAEARIGVWRLCGSCAKRRHTRVVVGTGLTPTARWSCDRCEMPLHDEDLDWTAVEKIGPLRLPRFLPKVGLSDLADALSYGFAGSASYAGGVEHVVRSRLWAQPRFGDIPPELVLDPQQVFVAQDNLGMSVATACESPTVWDSLQTGKYPAVFYTTLVPHGDVTSRRAATARAANGNGHLASLYPPSAIGNCSPGRTHPKTASKEASMPSPEERAASIIAENRFLSLATIDASGPWIAPINYVVGPGSHLHFYSATESRHSRALATDEHVAVSIFDSRATSDEVDGMQLSGICSEVAEGDLDAVHAHYFEVNFSDPEEREWWLRPSKEFTGGGLWRFYRLSLQEVFVIDFESIEQERLDKRILVDASKMWQLLGTQVG